MVALTSLKELVTIRWRIKVIVIYCWRGGVADKKKDFEERGSMKKQAFPS